MRTVLKFDEINKPQSMPFGQYFGEMDLNSRQKEERIALAKDLEAALLYFMDAVVLYLNDGVGNNATLLTLLIEELTEVFDENGIEKKTEESIIPDILAALLYRPNEENFVNMYTIRLAQEIFDSTMNHIDDPYYLSEDRARHIAEEESNTVYNHVDYKKAVKQGKKYKMWITQRDNKVRHTHRAVESKRVPIDDMFTVGAAQMLYPRDVVNGWAFPEEIVNCRCSVKYL